MKRPRRATPRLADAVYTMPFSRRLFHFRLARQMMIFSFRARHAADVAARHYLPLASATPPLFYAALLRRHLIDFGDGESPQSMPRRAAPICFFSHGPWACKMPS